MTTIARKVIFLIQLLLLLLLFVSQIKHDFRLLSVSTLTNNKLEKRLKKAEKERDSLKIQLDTKSKKCDNLDDKLKEAYKKMMEGQKNSEKTLTMFNKMFEVYINERMARTHLHTHRERRTHAHIHINIYPHTYTHTRIYK